MSEAVSSALVGGAVLSFIIVLIGFFIDPQAKFAFSYLFAFFFFLTICMGGLFWTLVHHAMDAEWSVVVRRQLENLASLLPVMGVLFIPAGLCGAGTYGNGCVRRTPTIRCCSKKRLT